jgi:DNA gyrase subunit A
MLFVSSSGHGKRTSLDEFSRQGRGGQGVRGMKLTGGRGEVVAAFTVSPDDELLVFSSSGNIVRMGVSEISQQGRGATGVRVARLADGESVVAVARVLENDAVDGAAEIDAGIDSAALIELDPADGGDGVVDEVVTDAETDDEDG